MHVLALHVELRFPGSRSLKERRMLLRPIVDGIRSRFEVSVAEIGHQDTWQRCALGIALVGGNAGVVADVADRIERFIWQAADTEVLDITHHWLEQ